MLEDHADVFAFGLANAWLSDTQSVPVTMMTLLIVGSQHIDAADERRFAGTTFPDDAENFAVMDSQ